MSTNTHIGFGISPDGAALIIKPIYKNGGSLTPVILMRRDVESVGFGRASILLGRIMIDALGAYYPELDRYQLISHDEDLTAHHWITPLQDQYRKGDTRDRRMGLGVGGEAADPVLVVASYDGDRVIGEDDTQSAQRLAELGQGVASSVIGDLMLRRLAAMHQDVLSAMSPK